jgi:hypothetical protein
MLEQDLRQFELDLIELPDGKSAIFDYPSLNTIQMAKKAKGIASGQKFCLKIEADYEGLRITKVRHHGYVNVRDTISALRCGQRVRIKGEFATLMSLQRITADHASPGRSIFKCEIEGACTIVSKYDATRPIEAQQLETIYLEELKDKARRQEFASP